MLKSMILITALFICASATAATCENNLTPDHPRRVRQRRVVDRRPSSDYRYEIPSAYIDERDPRGDGRFDEQGDYDEYH